MGAISLKSSAQNFATPAVIANSKRGPNTINHFILYFFSHSIVV